ncbi:MAG TPA: flippase [Candidatus Acidoferrum sp.]|nr:flippase [Candidatus Acidoferrum sp.]
MQVLSETETMHNPCEQDAAHKQIRGSSLFLAGRFLSMGINFSAQVLMVRYLATAEYGALAYALAAVAFFQPFATLGLHEAVSRYVPIYQENREFPKVLGTILFSISTVFLAGLLIIAAIWSGPALLTHFMTQEKLPRHLLSVLILVVPLDAADELFNSLFASLAGTRAIFIRKYILGPGLKLGAVLLLVGLKSTVVFLAYGYLVASAAGIAIYAWMLVRLLQEQSLFQQLWSSPLKIPARQILAFVLPGLSSSLVTVAIHSVNIFILGYLRTVTEVAYYRAVVPVAQLNGVVMASFTLLYMPAAARLLAKSDYKGINKLYWQTAAWMSVMSFPVFALTFSFAQPLTESLYGARYAPSGPILALLALGSYTNVALGFNLQTLKVLERLRYIILVSLIAALVDIGLNLLLVPRHGAFGAAIGTTGTLIIYNLLMQMGLLPTSSFNVFDRRYLAVYLSIAISAGGLFFVQSLLSMSLFFGLLVVACMSIFVFSVTRKKLRIAETFPELLKMPLMRLILA